MAFRNEGRARVIADRLRSLRITDGPRSTLGRIREDIIPEIALHIASSNHNELSDGELRNLAVNYSIRHPHYERSLAETERELRALRGRPD